VVRHHATIVLPPFSQVEDYRVTIFLNSEAGRCAVLSDREQRVLDELERSYDLDAPGSSARFSRPRSGRSPVTVVVLASAVPPCLFLLLTGAASGALALATAAALGWALWRFWPELGSGFSATTSSAPEKDETTGGFPRGPHR
jgi:hypothetical protein